MWQRLISWFRFRREIERINARAAKVAKMTLDNKHRIDDLIEIHGELIQNLQKEIAAGVLERNALADRITALEKSASKPGPIQAPNWRGYLKLTEDESVTA